MIGRNELSIGDQQRTRSTGAPRSLACESVENILTPLARYPCILCAAIDSISILPPDYYSFDSFRFLGWKKRKSLGQFSQQLSPIRWFVHEREKK
jgi:hypothetical protein